jgi:hypothetical protein
VNGVSARARVRVNSQYSLSSSETLGTLLG